MLSKAKSRKAGSECWKDGRVEEWKSGRVEEWKSGRMEEWKDGRMEGWKDEVSARSILMCG